MSLTGRAKWDARMYNLTVFEKFAMLPERSWKSPYLLFFKPTFCGWERICPPIVENLINNRTDIIWVGHDLGGMKLHHPGLLVPGGLRNCVLAKVARRHYDSRRAGVFNLPRASPRA